MTGLLKFPCELLVMLYYHQIQSFCQLFFLFGKVFYLFLELIGRIGLIDLSLCTYPILHYIA